jgi:hypothetical protein
MDCGFFVVSRRNMAWHGNIVQLAVRMRGM